ncbi:Uu.00g108110.m01.CDS01 [Anthostomella pinea]|uniref:Uu.00g108110.m01.CDS01 n=1 Tax=Anthostomella pinea TaxID=933095 RepID=A0AAI8YG16_9PEZI|nr:Uu.00g108110.m01.CDS01 [Anthostomella pinea]
MSGIDSPAGSPAPAQSLHEEETNDRPRELGDYDVADAADSDKDSDALSEIDEDQFDDYDPSAARIEEKPVEIDEDVARTLKASKRKGTATKKPKEGRREKKRARDRDDNDGADGEILTTKRVRKTAGERETRKASPAPEIEENLTPEERRRRAIERAAKKEIKPKTTRRKKKDEEDLEDELDEQIADLKVRMENACKADIEARKEGQPALQKLKLLPEVMSLLNRNNNQAAVVDPDTNFLQHVTYFLEPLDDGSLPAYSIQRDIFQALIRLPIEKEALKSSGIGKIVLFYTKSKRPEIGIKRMAERLLGEWSRPILNRTDDYKKRRVETRNYDAQAVSARLKSGSSQVTLTQRPAAEVIRDAERQRILAPQNASNRARVVGLPQAYTIAPVSSFDASRGPEHRPIGASGHEAFRKMTQRGKKKG